MTGSGSVTERPSLVDLAPAVLFERSGLLQRARAGLSGAADTADTLLPPAVPANPGPAFDGLLGRARTTSTIGRGPMSLDANEENKEQAVVDALTPREWDQLVDLVVDRLEDRVRDELARRGRRFSPGVF